MTAGALIRARRKAAGLTLQEMAGRLGTDKSQVCRLESEERRLTVRWVERIAAALDAHPADLIWPRTAAPFTTPSLSITLPSA